jgi:glycosyltransferase involved in cell wall biosynthesis
LSALPTISVVTPSYNQARYLEATLRSVLLQGYPKLEYIVMDGGSSDGSVSIIQHYAPWLTSWTSGPDGGQSAAINAGFARSTGQILAWLNSDDHYLPETLWTIAQAAIEHPDTDAFAGGSERLDQSGKSLGIFMPPGLTHAEVVRWRQQHLPQPSCFFRRCAWERSGPLDEGLYHLMDYDLWLRMTRGSRFLRLERVLSREIRHDQAKNLAHPAEGLVALWLIKHRHDPAVAEAEMVEHVREFMRIQRQAQALTSSLPYRIARPLIKLFSR